MGTVPTHMQSSSKKFKKKILLSAELRQLTTQNKFAKFSASELS